MLTERISKKYGTNVRKSTEISNSVPDDEEIMTLSFFVLTQCRRVTDGQTRCDRYS